MYKSSCPASHLLSLFPPQPTTYTKTHTIPYHHTPFAHFLASNLRHKKSTSAATQNTANSICDSQRVLPHFQKPTPPVTRHRPYSPWTAQPSPFTTRGARPSRSPHMPSRSLVPAKPISTGTITAAFLAQSGTSHATKRRERRSGERRESGRSLLRMPEEA
jgi:hypothetical protein